MKLHYKILRAIAWSASDYLDAVNRWLDERNPQPYPDHWFEHPNFFGQDVDETQTTTSDYARSVTSTTATPMPVGRTDSTAKSTRPHGTLATIFSAAGVGRPRKSSAESGMKIGLNEFKDVEPYFHPRTGERP
jgi:hypothetical protein